MNRKQGPRKRGGKWQARSNSYRGVGKFPQWHLIMMTPLNGLCVSFGDPEKCHTNPSSDCCGVKCSAEDFLFEKLADFYGPGLAMGFSHDLADQVVNRLPVPLFDFS